MRTRRQFGSVNVVVLLVAVASSACVAAAPMQDAGTLVDAAATDAAGTLVDAGVLPLDAANGQDASTGDTDAGIDAPTTSGCALGASCTAADKACAATVANLGLTKFGLRMAEIDFTAPTALASGLVASTLSAGAYANNSGCNQAGNGTFTWLLQFDVTAMTLKTGGAKPVASPSTGYSFDDETVGSLHVQPATYTSITPGGSGSFTTATGVDLVMPIFLDSTGTSSLLFPMHEVIISGTLSSNNDCIGTYNAAGLQSSNSCLPSSTTPGFVKAGTVTAYTTLEEADAVTVSVLNESLCVLLSGDGSTYGVAGSGGTTVCKRDSSNKILYVGNWCASTNAAATMSCADSVQINASFAANGIAINN